MPIDMQVIEKWKNLGGWLSGVEARPYDDPDTVAQSLPMVKFYPETTSDVPWSLRVPEVISQEGAWKKVLDHLGRTEADKIWYVDSEGIDGQIMNEAGLHRVLEELDLFEDQLWDESSYLGSYWFPPDQGGTEIGLYTHDVTGTKYLSCASTGSGSHKWLMF